MENDLEKMDLRLSEMEDKIDKLDVKLTQVVDAILGNPLTKQGGFIHDIDVIKLKIEELERKQSKLEDFKKRMYWTAGIGGVLFFIVQFIINVLINLSRIK